MFQEMPFQVDAEQHARQSGHAAGDDPHDADHLFDVDAGGGGQRGVVGYGSGGAAKASLVQEDGHADNHQNGDAR